MGARLSQLLDAQINSDSATQQAGKKLNLKMKAARRNAKDVPDAIDSLTDAQLDEFRDAFATFDSDGGGSIDHAELKALMASVGQMPSDEEVREMIKVADADGSGTVDFPEFVTLMAHKMIKDDDHDRVASAFTIFDEDGSGYVDASELQRIMINVGEPVTVGDCHALLREVDHDADGKVSYDEFCRVLGSRGGGTFSRDSSTEHLKDVHFGSNKADNIAAGGPSGSRAYSNGSKPRHRSRMPRGRRSSSKPRQ